MHHASRITPTMCNLARSMCVVTLVRACHDQTFWLCKSMKKSIPILSRTEAHARRTLHAQKQRAGTGVLASHLAACIWAHPRSDGTCTGSSAKARVNSTSAVSAATNQTDEMSDSACISDRQFGGRAPSPLRSHVNLEIKDQVFVCRRKHV